MSDIFKLRQFLRNQCHQKIKQLVFRFQTPDKSRRLILENGNIQLGTYHELIGDLGEQQSKGKNKGNHKYILTSEESIDYLGGPFEEHNDIEQEEFNNINYVSGIRSKVSKDKIIVFINKFQTEYISKFNSLKITMEIKQLFNVRQQLVPVFNMGQMQNLQRDNNNNDNIEESKQQNSYSNSNNSEQRLLKKPIQKQKKGKNWYMNKKFYFFNKKDRTTAESGSFEEEEDYDDDEDIDEEDEYENNTNNIQQQLSSQEEEFNGVLEYQDQLELEQNNQIIRENPIISQEQEQENGDKNSQEEDRKYQQFMYKKKKNQQNLQDNAGSSYKKVLQKNQNSNKINCNNKLSDKALEKLSIFEKNKQFLTPIKSDPQIYNKEKQKILQEKEKKEQKLLELQEQKAQKEERKKIQFSQINKNHILGKQEKSQRSCKILIEDDDDNDSCIGGEQENENNKKKLQKKSNKKNNNNKNQFSKLTDEEFFKDLGVDLEDDIETI